MLPEANAVINRSLLSSISFPKPVNLPNETFCVHFTALHSKPDTWKDRKPIMSCVAREDWLNSFKNLTPVAYPETRWGGGRNKRIIDRAVFSSHLFRYLILQERGVRHPCPLRNSCDRLFQVHIISHINKLSVKFNWVFLSPNWLMIVLYSLKLI